MYFLFFEWLYLRLQLVFQQISSISHGFGVKFDCHKTCTGGNPCRFACDYRVVGVVQVTDHMLYLSTYISNCVRTTSFCNNISSGTLIVQKIDSHMCMRESDVSLDKLCHLGTKFQTLKYLINHVSVPKHWLLGWWYLRGLIVHRQSYRPSVCLQFYHYCRYLYHCVMKHFFL